MDRAAASFRRNRVGAYGVRRAGAFVEVPAGSGRFRGRRGEKGEGEARWGEPCVVAHCDPPGAAGFSRENGERESLLEARWIAPRLRSGANPLGRTG